MLLEFSTAARRYFNQKFVGAEHQNEFDALKAYFGQLAVAQGEDAKALLGKLDSDDSVWNREHLEVQWKMDKEQDEQFEKYKQHIRSYWEALIG